MIEYSGKAQFVEVIEDGRIVKVTEDYARREGLLILRRQSQISDSPLTPKEKKDEGARRSKGFIGMDDLRKPLRKDSEILKELVENFHWILVQRRKARALTRKKVAEAINESETNVKMIENGVLPMNNFVLVNKLEGYYGISLRKNKVAEGKAPLRQIIDFAKKEKKDGEASEAEEIIDVTDAEKEGEIEKKLDALKDDEDFIDLGKL
jgi:ribosome-binding protein aMBF1 (putative translation factor)